MKLLIRTDADTRIGSGHALRCLALAQAWRRTGGEVEFLMTACTPSIEARIREAGAIYSALHVERGSAQDAIDTAATARASASDWIAIDGYGFVPDFQQVIKSAGHHLLTIDDGTESRRFCADAVLNQNLYAGSAEYPDRDPATRLLLGPRFALLREEFSRATEPHADKPPIARKLVMTLGGADPDNITGMVIDAIEQLGMKSLGVTVLIASRHPHSDEIRRAVENSRLRFELHCDATNVAELMSAADLAVAGAGTTTLELARMGVPALLVVLADNQRKVAAAAEAAGSAVNLGEAGALNSAKIAAALSTLIASPERRSTMTQNGLQLVDGRGAARVCEVLQTGDSIFLRPAKTDDAETLWKWANDPDARALSFHSAPIPWETHIRWLDARLARPEPHLWIVETCESLACGVVRFDVAEDVAVISINLDPGYRGRGLGRRVIREAATAMHAYPEIRKVRAWIKPENERSVRAFEDAGFHAEQPRPANGPDGALSFILEKKETEQ